MPARGLLAAADIEKMANRVQALGGLVSYGANGDGSQSAYELNINYLDALGESDYEEEMPDFDKLSRAAFTAKRFLASQAIMLALRGVPGIYFHSLFGSRSWQSGVKETGRKRTINRQKLLLDMVEDELADPTSLRALVFNGYKQLLQARRGSAAFHPVGEQQVLSLHPSIFGLLRISPDGDSSVLCLHNVSAEWVEVGVGMGEMPAGLGSSSTLIDLINGQSFQTQNNQLKLTLEPYQVLWLVSL